MSSRVAFGLVVVSLAAAMPVLAQGTAPDGAYACEYLSSANFFIPMGTVTARGGQMTYRGPMPDGWKQGPITYGGMSGPNGQPVVWVTYVNSVGISSNMRCLPKK